MSLAFRRNIQLSQDQVPFPSLRLPAPRQRLLPDPISSKDDLKTSQTLDIQTKLTKKDIKRFVHRQKQYSVLKEKSLIKQRQQKQLIEIQQFTFKPKLNPKRNTPSKPLTIQRNSSKLKEPRSNSSKKSSKQSQKSIKKRRNSKEVCLHLYDDAIKRKSSRIEQPTEQLCSFKANANSNRLVTRRLDFLIENAFHKLKIQSKSKLTLIDLHLILTQLGYLQASSKDLLTSQSITKIQQLGSNKLALQVFLKAVQGLSSDPGSILIKDQFRALRQRRMNKKPQIQEAQEYSHQPFISQKTQQLWFKSKKRFLQSIKSQISPFDIDTPDFLLLQQSQTQLKAEVLREIKGKQSLKECTFRPKSASKRTLKFDQSMSTTFNSKCIQPSRMPLLQIDLQIAQTQKKVLVFKGDTATHLAQCLTQELCLSSRQYKQVLSLLELQMQRAGF